LTGKIFNDMRYEILIGGGGIRSAHHDSHFEGSGLVVDVPVLCGQRRRVEYCPKDCRCIRCIIGFGAWHEITKAWRDQRMGRRARKYDVDDGHRSRRVGGQMRKRVGRGKD